MITTKSDSNSSKYIALFEEAFQFLVREGLEHDGFPATDELRENRKNILQGLVDSGATRFTSVQEYFSHLQDLLLLGGKKYLMLPLDEPVFEIDANKREITVPAEFKKNGISVQGDEIAESLIFRVNRFFDYADLREMIPQVQWENANKETGTSNIFVVDDSRNADYLYLMWPLKEEITKYPGTVKFSLRFYDNIDNELVYSWSTKIAAATINAGHDFSLSQLTTNVIDASSNFDNAIRNSKNTAAEDAAVPYFILNLDEVLDDSLIGVENAEYKVEEGNLPHLEAYISEEDPTQKLRVQAASSDTGLVTYSWVYRDTVDTSVQGGRTYYLIPSYDYVKTEDQAAVAHKVYYKSIGNNEYAASEFTYPEEMYERYSVVEVERGQLGKASQNAESEALLHVSGKYYAIARNSVGGNTEEEYSYIVEFPAPEKLEIAEGQELPANAFLVNAGVGSITVTANIDEHGAKAIYEWEAGTSITGPFTPISQLPEADQNKLVADGNVLTINNRPGFYRAHIISVRNYETIDLYTDGCKVTLPVAAPFIVSPLVDTVVSSKYGDAVMKVQFTPFSDDGLESEQVTYQWFTDTGVVIEGASGIVPQNSNLIQYVVPQGTRMGYYCELTNHIGNEVAVTRSAEFSVNLTEPDVPGQNEPEPEPEPTPSVAVSGVSKISASAVSGTEAQNNQEKAEVIRNGNNIVIRADLDELMAYEGGVGEHKYVAVDINTGESSIIGMTWRGSALTQTDVDEAAEVGLGAGHIVFWAQADVLANASDSITIGKQGYESVTLTVSFEQKIQG